MAEGLHLPASGTRWFLTRTTGNESSYAKRKGGRMKKRITSYLLIAVFSLAGGVGYADPLTIPNTFVSGAKAKAADVNANFQAVKNAVDNNDARISSLEAGWSSGIIGAWDNTGLTITATDCNILTVTVTSQKNGWLSLTGSGYFIINHVFGTADLARVSLSSISGKMNLTSYLTAFSVPKDAPTGEYFSPFSITGLWTVVIGTTNYYLVADVYSGAGYSSSAGIGHRQLTGIWSVPNK